MRTTPTAALVEETLIKDALELCGTRYELQAGYKHHLLKKLAHALQRTIAERDAQRAEVLRLTGERDAARAQLFANAEDDRLTDTLQQFIDRERAELTATRDLLTEENARLQARVATLELLRRGGK